MASKEDVAFKWGCKLSEHEEIANLRRRRSSKSVTKYSSCYVDKQLISIGDDVIIDMDDAQEAVGQIKELFNDSTQEEPYRALVHWYFKKHELSTAVKEKIGRCLSEEYELFWPVDDDKNLRGCVEEIDAETIRERCQVIHLQQTRRNFKIFSQYVVRFGFTIDHKVVSGNDLSDYLSKYGTRQLRTSVKDEAKSYKTLKANQAQKNTTSARTTKKRKASKSISDESEVHHKFKRCLANSRKHTQFDTTEVLDLVQNKILENGDNYDDDGSDSEASSCVSSVNEEQNLVNGEGKSNSKATPRQTGNHVFNQDDKELPQECIENEELEKEDKISKVRKTKKKKNGTAKNGLKKKANTSVKTLQKGKPKTEKKDRSRTKKAVSVDTKVKNKKKRVELMQKLDSADEYDFIPSSEEEREEETEYEEETIESDEVASDEDAFSTPVKFKKSTRTSCPALKKSTTKKISTKQQRSDSTTRKSVPPKTPKSRRKGRLSFATPCIPVRGQRCKTPVTPLEKARASLHVSAIPGSLPCREQQFDDICSFIEGKLSDDTGGCMYISGVPGTGKTATVHEVIRYLEAMKENEKVEDFQFYEINGMKVTQPNQVYVTFYKFLTGEKVTADHASSLLDKYFNNSAKRKEHIVLLVDELDQLWTRKQDVMYHLFDWPTRRHSKLIVIAIANTMDLPERMMINRVSSRLGLTRMTFQPYTFSQLQEIVTSRIKELDAFEPDAVQLVARKVAALSGDARRCLDICRRAVEIAEQEAINSRTVQELVGMSHVEKALNEMFSSPKIIAMKNLSRMEGFMLKSVLAEFRRSGLEEALFSGVYSQLVALCRIEGLSAPSSSLAASICSRLGAMRLLLVDPGKCDIQQRVRLNVNKDDILFALKTATKETVGKNKGKSR